MRTGARRAAIVGRRLLARRIFLALLALALLDVACAGDPPTPGRAAGAAAGDEVVVASMNFTESRLLAEMYAQALEAVGVPVRRELALGPRELVQPALAQGLVDLVPEYLGTALASLDPDPDVDLRDAGAVHAALGRALDPWDVVVLDPAPAENSNGLAVTRATASRHGLEAVTDLRPVAGGMVLGGLPECPTRPFCLLGFEEVYGLDFAGFVALDAQAQVVRALEELVVDVAVVFTTDPALATARLVLLDDDLGLHPAEHVVPVVRAEAVARHGERLVERVDAVSAHLTTAALRVLNWRVEEAGGDPAEEAHGWLVRQGLVPREGAAATPTPSRPA